MLAPILRCLACLGLLAACTDLTTGSVAAPDPVSTTPAPAPGTPTPTPGATEGVIDGPAPTSSPDPVSICPEGILVCDDFETEAPGHNPNAALWSIIKQNNNETVTIDTNRAYSGHQSVHIHTTNSGYEQAMLVNTSIFPVAGNGFYGRMFMYFSGNQPQTHFNLVTAWGTLQGQTAGTYVNYGGQFDMLLANYYNANNSSNILDLWQHAGIDSNGTYTDTTAMPTNRWACLEWQFKGASNEMDMWLDGNPVATMTLVGVAAECCRSTVWAFPPFRNVAVGWTVVGNTENFDHFDLWLDAVALDTQRIGCGSP